MKTFMQRRSMTSKFAKVKHNTIKNNSGYVSFSLFICRYVYFVGCIFMRGSKSSMSSSTTMQKNSSRKCEEKIALQACLLLLRTLWILWHESNTMLRTQKFLSGALACGTLSFSPGWLMPQGVQSEVVSQKRFVCIPTVKTHFASCIEKISLKAKAPLRVQPSTSEIKTKETPVKTRCLVENIREKEGAYKIGGEKD